MVSSIRATGCALILGGLLFPLPAASDWPQFQGPDRNGISAETGLARVWPEGGPRRLWTFELQEGFGGPAIRDGKVYVLDREESKRDVLHCRDLETGESLWTVSYDAPGATSHNGSRTTPTVTETHVYTVGLMGHFTCVDLATQSIAWQKVLPEEFPADKPNWGYSQSPSLYKNLVIVAPQSPEGSVAAYDQRSGERVWTSPELGGAGYSSPLVTTLAGLDQIVMLSAPGGKTGAVAGLSLEDGSVLWTYDKWSCMIPIPNVTVLSDDRVFITGEYGAGSAMIQIKRNGETFRVEELYTTDKCGSQIHQPLVIDNAIYANSNGNSRRDGLICMTPEGEVLWRTADKRELPTFERGNLLFADGMIINLDGNTGVLHLVAPSTSGYVEMARAPIFDGKKMWSPMALSDGKLVLRSQGEITCLDLKNP